MPAEFQREYLVRLPLPVAELYGRAYNGKDAHSRHDNAFYLLGDAAGAREFYGKGLEIRQKLAASDPKNTQLQRNLAISYERLAQTSLKAEEFAEAHDFYRREVEILEKMAEHDAANQSAPA